MPFPPPHLRHFPPPRPTAKQKEKAMFNPSIRIALREVRLTASTQYREVCLICGCNDGMGANDALACKLSSLKSNYERSLWLLADDRKSWGRRNEINIRREKNGQKPFFQTTAKPTWEKTMDVVRHLNPMMVKTLDD